MSTEPTQPSQIAIEACPFCGEALCSIRNVGKDEVFRQVYCRDVDCGARGPSRPSEQHAIVAWNNRAIDKATAELNKKLFAEYADNNKHHLEILELRQQLSDEQAKVISLGLAIDNFLANGRPHGGRNTAYPDGCECDLCQQWDSLSRERKSTKGKQG